MNKKMKSSRMRMMNRRKWGRGGFHQTTSPMMNETPSLGMVISAVVSAMFKRQKKG